MNLSAWINFVLSCGVTALNWLRTTLILGVPILYLLIGIFIMGVVLSAIPFRS